MDNYLLKPGAQFKFDQWNPNDKSWFSGNKEAGVHELHRLKAELYELQVAFYAERKHRIMIVLQGMDTSGKDGTIRHVFGGLDPQGIHVATFGKPSTLEMNHDYLWRIHQQTPKTGQITIFNRSHYEDVLAVRVRQLMPRDVWSKRFKHIVDFEHMLTDENTTVVKLFLHIDNEEQKKRLIKRIEDPSKHWKLFPEDIKDRALWPAYTEAYEEAITRTSTSFAPWYIIPGNRKWYRNLVVASIMVETLKNLDPKFPQPDFDPHNLSVQ